MRKKLLGIFAVTAVVFSFAVMTLPVGADQPNMIWDLGLVIWDW